MKATKETETWTIKELNAYLKVEVKDYYSTIIVAALFKKIYGVFPCKIKLSKVQAIFADDVMSMLPEPNKVKAKTKRRRITSK
jgi:hypothetical protein